MTIEATVFDFFKIRPNSFEIEGDVFGPDDDGIAERLRAAHERGVDVFVNGTRCRLVKMGDGPRPGTVSFKISGPPDA